MGLALRLGALTSAGVIGVMALVSGWQLALELRSASDQRKQQVTESLAPLARELQSLPAGGNAPATVRRFYDVHPELSRQGSIVELIAPSGLILERVPREPALVPVRAFTVESAVITPAISPVPLRLRLTVDDAAFASFRTARWKAWVLHIAVTAIATVVLLLMLLRHEITRPIERLVKDIRRMEQGFWNDVRDPGGAWELRWLAWRFRALGRELQRTTEHFVAAQQRAVGTLTQKPEDPRCHQKAIPSASIERVSPLCTNERLLRTLQDLLSATPAAPAARALASHAWESAASEAQERGYDTLRMQIEDASLRILEPEQFLALTQTLDARRPALAELANNCTSRIQRQLETHDVTVVSISHRVKHTAGIWKKMIRNGLDLTDIHDLIAVRVVVPTETDCYHALAIVHGLFLPLVGRFKDYIAVPKSNGYRSIHTTVRNADGSVFEVQLRSTAMHYHAEYGEASHAAYKRQTRVAAGNVRRSLLHRIVCKVRSRPVS